MSLHECAGRLEKQGDLLRIRRPVDHAPRALPFTLATRVQGDRDIILIPGVKGNSRTRSRACTATSPRSAPTRRTLADYPG